MPNKPNFNRPTTIHQRLTTLKQTDGLFELIMQNKPNLKNTKKPYKSHQKPKKMRKNTKKSKDFLSSR